MGFKMLPANLPNLSSNLKNLLKAEPLAKLLEQLTSGEESHAEFTKKNKYS